MGVSKNSGKTTQIIHFHRVFPYFHHPFLGCFPLILEAPHISSAKIYQTWSHRTRSSMELIPHLKPRVAFAAKRFGGPVVCCFVGAFLWSMCVLISCVWISCHNLLKVNKLEWGHRVDLCLGCWWKVSFHLTTSSSSEGTVGSTADS